MYNPFERYRQWRARRRVVPVVARRRHSATAKAALTMLAAIIVAALVLEWRGGRGGDTRLMEYARTHAVAPVDVVVAGARTHRIVLLADLPGSASPKRFAAQVIEALADGPGLDAVALPIDAELQPIIDRYLDTQPEDASILLARPRALREWEGTGRHYLDVYRTVWRLNQELGADRRIRILAIDLAGWPAGAGAAPQQLARLYGQRDEHMAEVVETQLFSRDARARVLFFVDGLQTLGTGGGHIRTGGTGLVETEWLGARLRRLNPGDVFTVLVDAPAGRAVSIHVAAYAGSRLAESFRRADGLPPSFGLRIGDDYDALIRPVRTVSAPGMQIDIAPQDYRLRDVTDAYVYLGS